MVFRCFFVCFCVLFGWVGVNSKSKGCTVPSKALRQHCLHPLHNYDLNKLTSPWTNHRVCFCTCITTWVSASNWWCISTAKENNQNFFFQSDKNNSYNSDVILNFTFWNISNGSSQKELKKMSLPIRCQEGYLWFWLGLKNNNTSSGPLSSLRRKLEFIGPNQILDFIFILF